MSSALLSEAECGEIRTVSHIDETNDTVRRLCDMGFTEGARVMKLFSSPSGGISAYLVRGSVIAVRRGDAERIFTDEP